MRRAAVVNQLVEWSLLTPEFRGLNPVISKLYILSEDEKINPKKLPMMFKMLPKWPNFAKLCHTGDRVGEYQKSAKRWWCEREGLCVSGTYVKDEWSR